MKKQPPARHGRGTLRFRRGVPAILAATVLAFAATRASAVILADSSTRNTAAPTGSLAAPWNLQGQFSNFLGTPIAPNLFIAAQHIGGGGAGQTLTLGGQTYTTTGSTDIGGSDLRVYQIDTLGGTHAFGSYSTLYDAGKSGSEVGKSLFVAGRGTARGAAYIANGTQRGWLWGASDGAQSWGTATVAAIANDDKLGDFVAFDFNNPGGIGLSTGDSSGGLFVYADGQWELAGVNYGTDGSWSTSASGPFVSASVYDARGLYVGDTTKSDFVPTDATSYVGSSYSSRISSNRAALDVIFRSTGNAALAPEPTSIAAVAAVAIIATRRRRVSFDRKHD